MADFHFSPRPNRADEVDWSHWSKEAFEKAQSEDKPVLLAISGVWCHWCHVMDETSYSEPDVINFINENYVPIRVDTDKHPEINERYNLGGWPTTAFLTSHGDLLTGGTYIPPEHMKEVLKQVKRIYHSEKNKLMNRDIIGKTKPGNATPETGLDLQAYFSTLENLKDAFDTRYGGFGDEPKFPMVDALELCAHRWIHFGDNELKGIFLKSLDAMREGGMYDHEEGGFFRYSTTRDWSVPHFEKMLEDNAGLLRLLCIAYQAQGDQKYFRAAEQTLSWIEKYMYLPEQGLWAGTQDADEKYYSLSTADRQKRAAPFVDKNIYTNWNAQLIEILFFASAVLDRKDLREIAAAALENLHRLCFSNVKGYAHYYDMNGAQNFGLLWDQAAVGSALTTAYQHLGSKDLLQRAEEIAGWTIKNLMDDEGGFYDVMVREDAFGLLAERKKDLQLNSSAARWLLTLEAITGRNEYGEAALGALASFTASYNKHHIHGATYALAIYQAKAPWIKVEVSGLPDVLKEAALLRTVLGRYLPNTVVIPRPSFEASQPPRAYVCSGTRCLEPVEEAKDLESVLQRLSRDSTYEHGG